MGQRKQDKKELLIDLARTDLLERQHIELDTVQVQRVEPVEFRDTSLGVPEPGMMYAQVITPGYIIELGTKGRSYIYHAAGERVVLASGPGTGTEAGLVDANERDQDSDR